MKLTIFFTLYVAFQLSAQNNLNALFVSQEWLETHLNDQNLTVLHVGTEEDFNTGHIEGAQLIESGEFSVSRNSLRWELPETNAFESVLMSKGITNTGTIVLVYGSDMVAPAFRLYFTLNYFGLGKNTHILDGGMTGWYSKKRTISTRSDAVNRNSFPLQLSPDYSVLANKYQVLQGIRDSSFRIIDARRNGYFTGETVGNYKRSGHIPGAINITWTDLFDANSFIKEESELRRFFSEVGEGEKVISYCHVGLRASVLFAISNALGYPAVLYDGSYNEWDMLDEQFPYATGN